MEDFLKIFINVADAVFAVDHRQCVVFWNEAAETLLGISAEKALGQPCWRLLQGTTPGGRPFCGPNCPILNALHRNQPVHALDLLVAGPAQKPILTNISTLFLPPDSESIAALIHMQRLPETHSQWPEPF